MAKLKASDFMVLESLDMINPINDLINLQEELKKIKEGNFKGDVGKIHQAKLYNNIWIQLVKWGKEHTQNRWKKKESEIHVALPNAILISYIFKGKQAIKGSKPQLIVNREIGAIVGVRIDNSKHIRVLINRVLSQNLATDDYNFIRVNESVGFRFPLWEPMLKEITKDRTGPLFSDFIGLGLGAHSMWWTRDGNAVVYDKIEVIIKLQNKKTVAKSKLEKAKTSNNAAETATLEKEIDAIKVDLGAYAATKLLSYAWILDEVYKQYNDPDIKDLTYLENVTQVIVNDYEMKSFKSNGQFGNGSIVNRQWLTATLPATVGIWNMSSISIKQVRVKIGKKLAVPSVLCVVTNAKAISLHAGLFHERNGAVMIEHDMGLLHRRGSKAVVLVSDDFKLSTKLSKIPLISHVTAWPTREYVMYVANQKFKKKIRKDHHARWEQDDHVWVFDPLFEATYDTYDRLRSISWAGRGYSKRGMFFEKNKLDPDDPKTRIKIINEIRNSISRSIKARVAEIFEVRKDNPPFFLQKGLDQNQLDYMSIVEQYGMPSMLAWALHDYWGNRLPDKPNFIINILNSMSSLLKDSEKGDKMDPLWNDVFNIMQVSVGQIHYDDETLTKAKFDISRKIKTKMIRMRTRPSRIVSYKKRTLYQTTMVIKLDTLPVLAQSTPKASPRQERPGMPVGTWNDTADEWKGKEPEKAIVILEAPPPAGQPHSEDIEVLLEQSLTIIRSRPIGDVKAIMKYVVTTNNEERNASGLPDLNDDQITELRRQTVALVAEKYRELLPNATYANIKAYQQQNPIVVTKKTTPETDQIFFVYGNGGTFRLHNSYTSAFSLTSMGTIGQSHPDGKKSDYKAEVFGYIAIDALSQMFSITNRISGIIGADSLQWINAGGGGAARDAEIRFTIPYQKQINFKWSTGIQHAGVAVVGQYQLRIRKSVKQNLDLKQNQGLPVIWSIYKLDAGSKRINRVYGTAGGKRVLIPSTKFWRVKLEFFLLQDDS